MPALRFLIAALLLTVTAGCHRTHSAGTLPPRVSTDFASGKVTLLGSVPDDATRARIAAKANALYGAANVNDQITVDSQVMNSDWLTGDAVFLPLIDNLLSDGQAAFNGKTLILTGEVPTEILRAQIIQDATTSAGGDVTIENHLQVKH